MTRYFIARRLLGAAAVAAAVARKLLPAVPDNPGSALALRPPIGELITRSHSGDRRLGDGFFPTARPQILYAPPPMPVQPVVTPAPPPRRRRKVVTETIVYEETEW